MLWVGRESTKEQKERKTKQRIQNSDTLRKGTLKIDKQFNVKKNPKGQHNKGKNIKESPSSIIKREILGIHGLK